MQGAEGRLVAGGRRAFADRRVAAIYSEVLFAPMYEGQTSFCELHETLTVKHGLALWQIYPLARDATGRAAWGDALWLREDALASMWRVMSPVSDASGRFVVLVGPDGVGKTAVARALLAQHRGPAALLPLSAATSWPVASFARTGAATAAEGGRRAAGVVLGWIRLLRNAARCWMGYLRTVRPALKRSWLDHRRPLDVRVRCPTICPEDSTDLSCWRARSCVCCRVHT